MDTKRKKPKKAKKQKNAVGRPTLLTPELALKIFILSRKGLTHKEIAQIFDMSEHTIKLWKKDPQFFTALKENTNYADAIVERSLFERAIGYEHEEDELFQYQGQVIVKRVVKHYPPDPTAMIFWLKNRQPKEWRDKVDINHGLQDETLEKYKEMNADELIRRQSEIARSLVRVGGNISCN